MLTRRIATIPAGTGTKLVYKLLNFNCLYSNCITFDLFIRNVGQVIAAVSALCNAGAPVPQSAIQRINSELKPTSGSCPFCVEGSSMAILAMKCLKDRAGPVDSLVQGISTRQIAYVKGKQDKDGGFDDLVATAMAIQV